VDVLHQHRLVLELVTLGLVVKLVVEVLVDLLRLWGKEKGVSESPGSSFFQRCPILSDRSQLQTHLLGHQHT
jgi:hypothetical protein